MNNLPAGAGDFDFDFPSIPLGEDSRNFHVV